MPSSNQSIVFVPGAWHSSSCYEELISALKASGYTGAISRVELPSVGSEEGSVSRWTFQPDIQAVRQAIQAQFDGNRDEVLVVSHSYGSVPTQDALKDFDGTGKVKQLIIAGFLLEPGECLLSLSGGVPAPWWDQHGDILYVHDPANVFYNGMSPAEQKKHVAALKSHAYVTKISPQFHATWMNPGVSTTYLVCTNDNANKTEWQEGGLERARGKHGASHIQVRRVEADHSPFLSKIDDTVSVIGECLGGLK